MSKSCRCSPLSATALDHCLHYEAHVYGPRQLVAIYLTATFVPYLISSRRTVVLLGIINIVFCAIAYFLYSFAFISVWCFFAAVISGFIYFEFVGRAHPRR